MGLSNLPTTPKPNPPQPTPTTAHQSDQSTLDPDAEPQLRKLKGSAQLNRWSRARAVRSGRKLDRPVHEAGTAVEERTAAPSAEPTSPAAVEKEASEVYGAKSIYMVSDGTGWTAEHAVNAALGQFDHCLVDRGCPVNTHLFSGVIMSFSFILCIFSYSSLQ